MLRGEASVPGLISAARDRALPTLPRVHAIWALTRLGAGGVLAELLQDSDAEVRAQAARGVGDSGFDAAPALAEALQHHLYDSKVCIKCKRSDWRIVDGCEELTKAGKIYIYPIVIVIC